MTDINDSVVDVGYLVEDFKAAIDFYTTRPVPGRQQVLSEDPSVNPIELFTPSGSE